MKKSKKYENEVITPDYNYDKITDITPDMVRRMGVEALAIDLDNTAALYGAYRPEDGIKEWVEEMREACIPVIIVSNTIISRALIMSVQLGNIPFIAPAMKPYTIGLELASKKLGIPVNKIAMVGDKLSTDTLVANRAGATAIKVNPLRDNEKVNIRLPRVSVITAMLTIR